MYRLASASDASDSGEGVASRYSPSGRSASVLVAPVRMAFALVLLVGLTVAASPAQAAFPGGNGKIVFVCNQTPLNDDICVIEPDGSGLTNISNTPDFGAGSFVEGTPEWSADGTKIAFRRGGGAQGIYVMDADGTNVVQLTSGPDTEPTWSPDGSSIAFNRDSDIWTVPSSGGPPNKVTNRVGAFPAFGGPSWSPDGARIALHRVTGPGAAEIYTIEPDGSDLTPVTADGQENRYPNWSPNGERIAFDCSPPRDICVIDADGTDETNLTDNAAQQNEVPAWSPDGTKIVFSSPVPRAPDVGVDFELYTMDSDGSNEQRLTANALNDRFADWQPLSNQSPSCTGVTASPDVLSPATREMNLISLSGATDPDGDPVSYQIDGVSQDEPVTARGDDTSPDAELTGAGASSNEVFVRAERNPQLNGRAYRIAYTASDDKGGSCSRTAGVGGGTNAKVAVPRHKKQAAVDDGDTNSWDSFTGAQVFGTLP